MPNDNVSGVIRDTYFGNSGPYFPQDEQAHGRAFGTAPGGNINFDEAGEVIARLWNESHPNYPMYRDGSADVDDTGRTNLTWKSGGRKPTGRTKIKPKRNIESYRTETGDSHTISIMEFTNAMHVVVRSNDSTAAANVARAFETFMFEFIGALKALGIEDIRYSHRLPDDVTAKAGVSQTEITIVYVVDEQMIFTVKSSTIRAVQIALSAITESVRT